jgi:pSer/pThr/pTyr-binding forkhead associated (FHA) protein/tetratricopeptide (TPR) repeat protein
LRPKVRFILKSEPKNFFEVDQEEFFIGRRKNCEICIDDPYISRRQARVRFQYGRYILENIGRNPTLVNAKQVERHFLQNGDIVTVGITQFVFQFVEEQIEVGQEHVFESGTVAISSPLRKLLVPRLLLTTSQGEITSYPLDKTYFIVGRSAEADIKLRDPLVSRKHCSIEKRDLNFFAKNFSETNPLLINNNPVSDQKLYSGDQLQVGPYLISFVSERPEDMKPPGEKIVVRSKGATWMIFLVVAFMILTIGGYVFYSKTYRPWKARRVLSSVSEKIASGSYLQAQNLLRKLLEANPPIDEARNARRLFSKSTLAFSQQLEKQGKLEEAKSFLIGYLKNYGANQEAEAVWDRLDLFRLNEGNYLENAEKYQAAIKEYATVREDGPHYDAAQKGIRRVWLAYQQVGLRKQNVAQLLKQAEEHFLAKRYLRPVNKNAYTAYQAVLALEPHNGLALQRIDQMKNFYQEAGERYFEGKDWRRSLLYFERYKLMDPDSSEINKKIAICKNKLAQARITRTKDSKSKDTLNENKERVRRLLKDSGAESATIMKYLFEEQAKGEESETPW